MRTLAGSLAKLRGRSDNLPQRWWFASTAIPLIAATIGPLSNVLSIAALVTPWRVTLPDNGQPNSAGRGTDDASVGIADPHWELIWNGLSLFCAFTGNIFLLLNFNSRVRYIIALPLSILLWVLSAVILIAILIAMNVYVPPIPPAEAYSQGYWHAVLASVLYLIGSGILTVNMIGYFRGHYPQQFHLDDDQRTLILQTMMFFFWLAAGSGVFCALEGFTYTDALYYADVSVLTIGFGDFAPKTDPGRGFLFVFQLIGVIFLGLVITSISRFVTNISADKIIKQHQKHARESTVGRTVTNEKELRERLGLPPRSTNPDGVTAPATETENPPEEHPEYYSRRPSLAKYGRLEIVGRTVTFHEKRRKDGTIEKEGGGVDCKRSKRRLSHDSKARAREAAKSAQEKRKKRRQKLLLLQKERDRFDAMRQIQEETRRWKQYWALGMAFLAFGVLWCLGALVFMFTEERISELRYFECLYLCFVSLLTIGYGDLSPKSNIGKPFFIVWSLVAVPIVTVLIQEMSSTVVSAVNRGTFKVAEWTILPKKGVLRHFIDAHPKLRGFLDRLQELQARRQERKRIARGFQVQDPDEEILHDPEPGDVNTTATNITTSTKNEGVNQGETLLAKEEEAETEHDLARELAITIKSVAHELRSAPPKRYTYEEWVHFTKLVRFSSRGKVEDKEEDDVEKEEEELVEWDWIGENSPMLADITEAEWVLDRLCESLNRYTRRQAGKNFTTREGAEFGLGMNESATVVKPTADHDDVGEACETSSSNYSQDQEDSGSSRWKSHDCEEDART
ncbi:hypothetical protein B0H63DRAFT_557841 [Podospora didyma]|uniref:Potassium channel domain-containing protein n=1 Tax=Podospora didyma TaxID=330526 RepID=A0AAE0U4Q2_9PEZI|nr:hypothetical protein B0H63DRAFT_557841 [Podospora didyma]